MRIPILIPDPDRLHFGRGLRSPSNLVRPSYYYIN